MSPSVRRFPAPFLESPFERQRLRPLLQEPVLHGSCSPFFTSGVLQRSRKRIRQRFNRFANVSVPLIRIRIVCFVSSWTAVLVSGCNAKEPHHGSIFIPASDREFHVGREVGHCHVGRRAHVQTNSKKVAAQQAAFPGDGAGTQVQTLSRRAHARCQTNSSTSSS